MITLLLYHKSGKMSSGNFAQSFSEKMARSVQNAQNGTRRPGSFRPSSRIKRKTPGQCIYSGILLRGLIRGKLFNSKVAYSLRAGKKGLTQPIEFKYKDIKKFWKTKNLIVLQVKQGENSTILTMRKEHVDVEKITAFLKEKKNAK